MFKPMGMFLSYGRLLFLGSGVLGIRGVYLGLNSRVIFLE